jgi:hypothetical protein
VTCRDYLTSRGGRGVLGAGGAGAAVLLWAGLVGELVGTVSVRLTEAEVATCRAQASSVSAEVVEIVRRCLGSAPSTAVKLRHRRRGRCSHAH